MHTLNTYNRWGGAVYVSRVTVNCIASLFGTNLIITVGTEKNDTICSGAIHSAGYVRALAVLLPRLHSICDYKRSCATILVCLLCTDSFTCERVSQFESTSTRKALLCIKCAEARVSSDGKIKKNFRLFARSGSEHLI